MILNFSLDGYDVFYHSEISEKEDEFTLTYEYCYGNAIVRYIIIKNYIKRTGTVSKHVNGIEEAYKEFKIMYDVIISCLAY